jgi:ribose 1,5-bisphosphate isomerase
MSSMQAIDALARDAESGASELVPRAVAILRRAAGQGWAELAAAARAVCAAQPSMAPIWNAAAAAVADQASPGALDRFEQRRARAGAALVRVAVEALRPEGARALRLVTCSFSGSVLTAVSELVRRGPVTVACAEGRPRFEGRRLAAALAAAGAAVEFYTDAGVADALPGASALVVGADAVMPGAFLNKCGTLALAAAAARHGVPAFVLATRDKFLAPALADRLDIVAHDPADVWVDPPAGIAVRNRYFERVPLDLVTGLATDAGLLGADMAEEACRANAALLTPVVLDILAGRM